MHDPDVWRLTGVHWHAYIEVRGNGAVAERTTRPDRLAHAPELVLSTPDDVVDWIATLTRRHSHRQRVRLTQDDVWAEVGDMDHVSSAMDAHHVTATRGDSLYADVLRESDRLYLYAEAVTPHQCPGHREEVIPP